MMLEIKKKKHWKIVFTLQKNIFIHYLFIGGNVPNVVVITKNIITLLENPGFFHT